MDDSENPEEEPPNTEAAPPQKRGRPVGKADQTPRYRRTAQEISDDKVKIAQMKLDALKEAEEARLANKKTRRPPRAKAAIQESALSPAPKPVVREESPQPKRTPIGSRRQALYDSWFPSSPRTKHF